MGKQKKTDALSERHFVQRAPLIPLIPFLQFDIGHKYIGTNNQPEKKRISPSTSGCSAYCYCITNSLSIVPAPVFSWNVSFKNAHFVRKEENTLFSYLRIPPESRPPSSSKKTYADGLPEKSLSLIRNSKSNLVLGISLI